MNDDTAHNRPLDARTAEGHLSVDDLNAYLDSELTTADRTRVDAHLQACAACRRDLTDLRATLTLLRGLPEQRPRRSFQISPEHARPSRGPWLSRLMPSLPTLRTATAVVAMLLIAVITGDILTNQDGEPDRAALEAPGGDSATRETAPAAAAPALTATVPAPTSNQAAEAAIAQQTPTSPPPGQAERAAQPTPTQEPLAAFAEAAEESDAEVADEAAPPAAPAAESAADEDIASDQGDGAAVTDQALGESSGAGGQAAAQSAAPTTTATPSPTATAPSTTTPSPSQTATPPPTPVPTPTPVAEPSSDGISRPSLWRVAEIGLGLLLLWLLVSLIGARRLRR